VSAAPQVLTAGQALLDRAYGRIAKRVEMLEVGLDAGRSTCPAYIDAVNALTALIPCVNATAASELLTTKQLAERLGCDERTVRRHKKAGRLKPAVTAGRVVRWRPDIASNGTATATGAKIPAKSAAGFRPARAVRQ